MSRLRVIRHRLDLKQSDFAALLEMHTSTVGRMETGDARVLPVVDEKLDLIEAALNKDPEVGKLVVATWEGLEGFLKTHAGWCALLDGGRKK